MQKAILSDHTPDGVGSALAAELPADTWRYFARNSLSFSFAVVGFRAEDRRRVSQVYAFCRLTDDLVDAAAGQPRSVVVILVESPVSTTSPDRA